MKNYTNYYVKIPDLLTVLKFLGSLSLTYTFRNGECDVGGDSYWREEKELASLKQFAE